MNSAAGLAQLAPPPDFRYVGLHPGPRAGLGIAAGALGLCASLGAALCHDVAERAVLLAAAAGAVGVALAGLGGPRVRRGSGADFEMAIVPWGILVDTDYSSRVLRWAGIRRVQLHMFHGRDNGTPTTKWSLVTVETDRERFTGRAVGALSLERLMVHLDAYACEASHKVALDLDGERAGEGPTDPDCELLIMAARAWVESAPASGRLDLPPAGYRRMATHAGSLRAVEVLREVLRDRTAREVDPRPFAAVVATEIHATELAEDLVALVQSPHAVLAAVAKVAAHKLGVATARVGALDEVSPFLLGRDVEALTAWAEAV